jgi:branched-chain amino acid transport system permease protein/urea transport system permease protein
VIIRQAMQLWFTANPRTVDDPIGGSFELAGFNVPWWRFTIVIAALVLIAAILFMLDRSRFGLYARATIRNPQLAATMGINISITRALLFGAGCALAGLGGALIAPINTLSPSFGVLFLVNSFLVVILGGQGSLRGLVAAAVVLGGSLAILQFMISTVFAQIAVLIIAIVGVRLRPLIVDKLATRSDRGRSVVTSSPSIDP